VQYVGTHNSLEVTRLLNCYVFPVLKYGCESWIVFSVMLLKGARKKISLRAHLVHGPPLQIHAFEHCCFRRMLNICWKDKVSNTGILAVVRLQS